eukprot:34405-Pleurochrysis_carterae.AAC.5
MSRRVSTWQRHQCQAHWAPPSAQASPCLLRLERDAGFPDEGRCPAWHKACREAAIALLPGRPGRRPGGARRPPSRLRRLVQLNAARRARGTWQR